MYYGQSFLLKGSAREHQGKYGEALDCVDGYEDLSWFEGLNDTGRAEVAKFKIWAKANRYNLEVLNGNEAILPEYVAFLKNIRMKFSLACGSSSKRRI
ncbi:hypothetical protein HMSSN036_45260 [Paenibacillus macerans]|nr:hypothetical protein HMSSN036_45260 [Paenibacillus macerans]